MADISNFPDLIYLSFLLSHIASPIHTTTALHWQPLIAILTNKCNSGNLAMTLSDHHAQFLNTENQHDFYKRRTPARLCFLHISVSTTAMIYAKQDDQLFVLPQTHNIL